MLAPWTRHIKDPSEKEDFENSIRGAQRVLERLKTLLDEEEKALDQTELDAKAYDNPSWAYKQAFKNGLRKGISIIKPLLDLDKETK